MKVAPRHARRLLCLRGIIKRNKIQGNCHLRALTGESRVKTCKRREINFIMFYFNFFCIPFWQTFERSTLLMVDKTTHFCIFCIKYLGFTQSEKLSCECEYTSGNWSFYADQWIPSGWILVAGESISSDSERPNIKHARGEIDDVALRCLWSWAPETASGSIMRGREGQGVWWRYIITFRRHYIITRIFPKVQAEG